MNKDRANELLSYGIAVLRGKAHYRISRKTKIHIALILLDELKDLGACWQVKILNAWLHRAQRGDFDG